MFQETSNQNQFQGHHNRDAGREYQRSLVQRAHNQAQTLAQLTGWSIEDIRRQSPPIPSETDDTPFWTSIWK